MSPYSERIVCISAPAVRAGTSRISQKYVWARFLRKWRVREKTIFRCELFTCGFLSLLCALAIGSVVSPSDLFAETAPGAPFAQPAVLTRPFAGQARSATFVLTALSLTKVLVGLAVASRSC